MKFWKDLNEKAKSEYIRTFIIIVVILIAVQYCNNQEEIKKDETCNNIAGRIANRNTELYDNIIEACHYEFDKRYQYSDY